MHLEHITLAMIKTDHIRKEKINKQSESWTELVKSIAERGVINPILVRPLPDGYYGLIEGLLRYEACLALCKQTIPAMIHEMTDAEVEEAQMIGPKHCVQTRPVELAVQLRRLLQRNPDMTIDDLANKIHRPASWIHTKLKLLKLSKKLVDEFKINLGNAASLPKRQQNKNLIQAQTETINDFDKRIRGR